MECSKVSQEHVETCLENFSGGDGDLMSTIFEPAQEKTGPHSCVTSHLFMECTNKVLFQMLGKKEAYFFKTQYGANAAADYDDDNDDDDDSYDDEMTPVKGSSRVLQVDPKTGK